ncbi:MAG TPA: isoprenylcysteine carboxylmethyltransferase family protein [Terriglobia bacterium]|jgi:protein-S-isoprenylcysteine O-methyltransferase Ste14|nr:isoprenylcysteine carboxylmethyltransferase family protein [Terriglobia bacterium]
MSFHDVILSTIGAAWIAFIAYWLIMAFRVKRAVKRQGIGGRLLQVLGSAATFMLMWHQDSRWGVLSSRFVGRGAGWALAGAILTCAGVAIAIWARTILGGNWSSSVTVKQDHTLIRTGPYTVVRHPIYSGLILAIFGTALALGEFRDLLAVGVLFATFLIKSRTEERFMTEQFGHDYEHYRHETKTLIPFIF